MKLDRKVFWLLAAFSCFIIIFIIWITQSVNKAVSLKAPKYPIEKSRNDSEWLRYQVIRKKLSELNKGWKKPIEELKANNGFDVVIPINDAVAIQINEIKRIRDEEILGKLSEANRVYQEYRQNLFDELKINEAEKTREAKNKLEADLAFEKRRQNQTLIDYQKDIERKNQLTLINLELQKKILIFSFADYKKQQSETERIDSEIARIRSELKKKIDERSAELKKEFELYQERRINEYHAELSNYHYERERQIRAELNRFRKEQLNEFRIWDEQRKNDVEQAIELRRSQQ